MHFAPHQPTTLKQAKQILFLKTRKTKQANQIPFLQNQKISGFLNFVEPKCKIKLILYNIKIEDKWKILYCFP